MRSTSEQGGSSNQGRLYCLRPSWLFRVPLIRRFSSFLPFGVSSFVLLFRYQCGRVRLYRAACRASSIYFPFVSHVVLSTRASTGYAFLFFPRHYAPLGVAASWLSPGSRGFCCRAGTTNRQRSTFCESEFAAPRFPKDFFLRQALSPGKEVKQSGTPVLFGT